MDETGGEEGDGDLVLLRRVCVGKGNGRFLHEAHCPSSFTSFDTLGAHDFDSPIVRGLAFEYVPLGERRPVGGGGRYNGRPTANGQPNGRPVNDSSHPTTDQGAHGKRAGGRRKCASEELYERYLAWEVTLSNPLLVSPPNRPDSSFVSPYDTHHHSHHRHHHHHHRRLNGRQGEGEGAYEAYVSSAVAAEKLCDEAVMLVESSHLPVSRQRVRGVRRRHSFDDYMALTRDGVTSFDDVLGKGDGEGREGKAEEGGKAGGTIPSATVVSTASAAGGKAGEAGSGVVGAGGEKGGEAGEKGLQLHRQIGSWLRRLGGQPTTASTDANATTTLPPVKLPTVPEVPVKPDAAKPSPPAPPRGDTASDKGKTGAPLATAPATVTVSALAPPPLPAPTPVGLSDPAPSVVVEDLITADGGMGEKECRALRGALQAVKEQQEALLRLLARAEERERAHAGQYGEGRRADRF